MSTLPKVPPKIVPFSFGDEPVNVEDTVSATCIISSGDHPVDIEWLFNGYHINAFSGISVLKGGKRNSMLTIDSANAQHAGNYTCLAKNQAASVLYSAELIVNGLTISKKTQKFLNNFFYFHSFTIKN